MISAAERRAKIEKLRRDREAKEKERAERQAKQEDDQKKNKNSSQIINQILANNNKANENLTQSETMAAAGQVKAPENSMSNKLPLRVATYVVDFEISPLKKPEMYDKELQCDLPDPRAARLQGISENDEYNNWQDDFDSRLERNLTSERGPRRSSTGGRSMMLKSQTQSVLDKKEEEIKATELPKAEAEQVMKQPDFLGFFDTSSRLIERALGQEFNLMDEFFDEEDENKDNDRMERGSKLHKKFVF